MDFLKEMNEKKQALQARMCELVENAKTEKRALTEEETKEFNACENDIKGIDQSIAMEEKTRAMKTNAETKVTVVEPVEQTVEEREIHQFAEHCRAEMTGAENRANLDKGGNGAVIPTTVVNKVIDTLHELCPIFKMADAYHIRGNVKLPKYTATSDPDDVTCAYATEFSDLTAHSGKFVSVDLGGFVAGSLVKISKSLINNSDIDVTNYMVKKMAEKIAIFINHEMLIGTASKMEGAVATTNTVTSASKTAISTDDLIALQCKVKKPYQKNCRWVMNRNTFTLVCKLKDNEGRPIVMTNYASEFPYVLLGKPVDIDENMADLGSEAKPVLYMDYTGMAYNMPENITIEILRELYAAQHVIGVNGWFEMDCKVADENKIACMVCPA